VIGVELVLDTVSRGLRGEADIERAVVAVVVAVRVGPGLEATGVCAGFGTGTADREESNIPLFTIAGRTGAIVDLDGFDI